MNRILHILLTLLFLSCSSKEDVFPNIIEKNSSDKLSSLLEIGSLNAVKKARQMTDISFTPLKPIEANHRTYKSGKKYTGLIYSSVKEIGTYVGPNITFHTFMTAIHNPRSKIYTEKINELPYHGTNCKAYYGTVCSGLVSYALGIQYGSYDFPKSNLMVEVDHNEIDSIQVADVLWRNGHVALITDVIRSKNNHVTSIEISEAQQSGCIRYTVLSTDFNSFISSSFERIYRYKDLYKNIDYTPAPEFVPVENETPIPFVYNDYLCVDKGDKSCYLEKEKVTINIMHDYEYLEIYKDNEWYMTVDASIGEDVILEDLPYGDYKATICYGSAHEKSDFTYWKVVNIELTPDRFNGRLYFKSANAIPYRVTFSNLHGSRMKAKENLFIHNLNDEDRMNGYIDIPKEQTQKEFPYINFYCATEYGKIKNEPVNWFSKQKE